MYQSLYRKYRPNNFDEVVGQEVVVKTLKNAILNQILNHAYLFTGPRGTGKTSIAKIFAKTINCENLNNTNPCNQCVNCTQINNKQSVDIIEIDAASNNGVDEIRELRSKASLVPTTGKYKVYIIDEVHMLTTGAFNALLKTLEEPPAHIIFILATTEPHKIPATILSRCQRFDFKKIPRNQMIERLKYVAEKENLKTEESIYLEIARLSDGCMRDALSIFDQVIAFSEETITLENVHEVNGSLPSSVLIKFLNNILDANYQETFKLIDEYDNKGKNYVKLSEELLLLLRNIMLYITVPNYIFDSEEKVNYENISNKIELDTLFKYIKIINESIVDMKKANNTKIIFEMMIVNLLNNDYNKSVKLEIKNVSNDIKEQPKEEIKKVIEYKVENKIQTQQPKQNMNEITKENEIEQKNIEITTEESNQKKYNKDLIEKLENLRNIRINNTLCNFNKKVLLEYKKRIDEIRNFLIDPDYCDVASIIIDGELKAASDNSMIFIYKTKRMELEFNQHIVKIDEMLNKIFNNECKAIATDEENWENIKKEFNSKTKQYEMMVEPSDLNEYLGNSDNDETIIDNMFGEIVEYN